MINYFSISTFRQHLSELLKVRRKVYASLPEEIGKEFIDKDIDEIRQNRDMILAEEEAVIIKLRLPDKRQRLSRANGYRLIYLVSKKEDVVVFLDVYPKNGPMQKISVSSKELENLVEEFIREVSFSTLGKYSF